MYGEQISWFARFMQRFQSTPVTIVKAELKEAELAALQSKSNAEYAALNVKIHTLTAEFHEGRVERFKEFLSGNMEDGKPQPVVQIAPAYAGFQD